MVDLPSLEPETFGTEVQHLTLRSVGCKHGG